MKEQRPRCTAAAHAPGTHRPRTQSPVCCPASPGPGQPALERAAHCCRCCPGPCLPPAGLRTCCIACPPAASPRPAPMAAALRACSSAPHLLPGSAAGRRRSCRWSGQAAADVAATANLQVRRSPQNAACRLILGIAAGQVAAGSQVAHQACKVRDSSASFNGPLGCRGARSPLDRSSAWPGAGPADAASLRRRQASALRELGPVSARRQLCPVASVQWPLTRSSLCDLSQVGRRLPAAGQSQTGA